MNSHQRLLGYAGLIPFVLLSLAAVSDISHARFFLLGYAALIFSFLGGILWGISLGRNLPAHVSLVSVSCMLWSWLWLLMPGYDWFWLAALSFIALWCYEWLGLRHVYHPDFLYLRGQLSLVAALSLVMANL